MVIVTDHVSFAPAAAGVFQSGLMHNRINEANALRRPPKLLLIAAETGVTVEAILNALVHFASDAFPHRTISLLLMLSTDVARHG